jgi:dolichol-phosphate mannosyltransferase
MSDWQVPTFKVPRWKGKQKTYSVLIPVINEGDRIGNLLRRMSALKISSVADVVLVDGGSTDGSLDASLLDACDVAGLLIKTGPGKLSAQLRCGYAFLLEQGYDGVVTIDGNDKDDPDAIPRIIEELRSGVDFVQASRFVEGGEAENTPRLREFAIRWIHAPALSLASGFRWTDTTQGFRGYSRRFLLDERVAPFRDVFTSYELLAYLSYRAPKLGFRCREIGTIRRYPKGETPTKIAGWRGNVNLLSILWTACTGGYNPR